MLPLPFMVQGLPTELFWLQLKKDHTGKPRITYDFNYGWNQPARIPEMSNAFEYANIMNELPIYKTIPVAEWGAAWTAIKTNRYL